MFQLISQFPTVFEFNSALLLFLAREVHSLRFGTFLFNHDRDRIKHGVKEQTVSIWTYVNDNAETFKNPFYEEEGLEFLPSSSYLCLRVWEDYFLQWTPYSDYHTPEEGSSPHTHKESIMRVERQRQDEISRIRDQISKTMKLEYELNKLLEKAGVLSNGVEVKAPIQKKKVEIPVLEETKKD